MRTWKLLSVATAVIGANACVGIIGGDDVEPSPLSEPPPQCDGSAVEVVATPLRRLTRTEYNNAVRDLLGDDSRPADSFLDDEKVGGYAANAAAPVSEQGVAQYLDGAERVAKDTVAQRLDTLSACDVASTDCVRSWLVPLAKRAFRRPLSQDQETAIIDVYEQARADWDATMGVELALRSVLASPYFLYHVEGARPLDDSGVAPLDGYEVAARLSFFLWQSLPDDELLAAADDGSLTEAATIERHVARMLDDPRASEGLATFAEQWLDLERLDTAQKDGELFPEWNNGLAADMRQETLEFAAHVFRSGDVTELLTVDYSFASGALASLYGASPDASGRIQLDADERAGVLTHASLLAMNAHADSPSVVHRGKLVREQFLCDALPPPPDDVDFSLPRLESDSCKSCHLMMDPIGTGFDRYDALGRYTVTDIDGASISGEGEVIAGAPDVDGSFVGAVELAHKLGASDEVRDCIATQVFRYAFRRSESNADACSRELIGEGFQAGDYSLRDLMVAIATSYEFRHRRPVE